MCAQVRSASIRSRASWARGSACWASDWPRCASWVRCRCPAVSAASRLHQPRAHRRRADQEVPAARPPAPGRARRRPRRASPLAAPARRRPSSGADALPRSPSPSNGPADRQAGRVGRHQPQRHRPGRRPPPKRPAGPDVAVGLPGRGHPALARVQPHARRPSDAPRSTAAPRSGLRDPASENASVDRCRPAAIAAGCPCPRPRPARRPRRSASSRPSRWTRRPRRARGRPSPPRAARRRRRRIRPAPSVPAVPAPPSASSCAAGNAPVGVDRRRPRRHDLLDDLPEDVGIRLLR